MFKIPLRPIGQTGLQCTVIGFGALEIGRDWGVGSVIEKKRPEESDAEKTLQCVLELGVNLIDSASAYHRSEERIGKFIADRRGDYILATKCGEHNREPDTYYDFSFEAISRSIQNSLDLLRTKAIDILQIHFGPDPLAVLDNGGCVKAMKEAREKNQVRLLGASIDGPVLDRCIESGDFEVVQVGYSLLNQKEGDRIAKAHDRGIGVLIRSGLAGGWLTTHALRVPKEDRPPAVNALLDLCKGDGKLLTALSLQFLVRHSGISSVLVGSKSCDNVRTAIEAIAAPIDEPLLGEASRLVRKMAPQSR